MLELLELDRALELDLAPICPSHTHARDATGNARLGALDAKLVESLADEWHKDARTELRVEASESGRVTLA